MVSNNMLASLVVIAIIIAVAGMMVTLSTLTQIGVTGAVTGTANVTVGEVTSISIPVNSVNFGSMNPGDSDNTTDGSPAPFKIQNDGNVNVNVTVNATSSLWTSSGYTGTNDFFQGKCRDNETNACGTGSVLTFTDIPVSAVAVAFITNMPYASSQDEANFDLNVTVPSEETPESKSSVLTFTATKA